MKQELIKWGGKVYSEIVKRSPSILTGCGVAGLFITAYLTGKATLEAKEKIDNLPEDADTIDKIKAAVPCYIPAAVTAITSAACIIGSNTVNSRRQAVLATAYSMSEAASKEFQDKVTETLGEKKVQKVKDDINKDRLINNPIENATVIETGTGTTLFLDAWSGRYFKSDIELIRKVINDLNDDILNGHYVTLTDFYYPIGLPATKMSDEFGWNINSTGKIDIDFSAQMTQDGKTSCVVLDYDVLPTFDYGRN